MKPRLVGEKNLSTATTFARVKRPMAKPFERRGEVPRKGPVRIEHDPTRRQRRLTFICRRDMTQAETLRRLALEIENETANGGPVEEQPINESIFAGAGFPGDDRRDQRRGPVRHEKGAGLLGPPPPRSMRPLPEAVSRVFRRSYRRSARKNQLDAGEPVFPVPEQAGQGTPVPGCVVPVPSQVGQGDGGGGGAGVGAGTGGVGVGGEIAEVVEAGTGGGVAVVSRTGTGGGGTIGTGGAVG